MLKILKSIIFNLSTKNINFLLKRFFSPRLIFFCTGVIFFAQGFTFFAQGSFFCTGVHFFCTGLIFFAHGVIFFAHHCIHVRNKKLKLYDNFKAKCSPNLSFWITLFLFSNMNLLIQPIYVFLVIKDREKLHL